MAGYVKHRHEKGTFKGFFTKKWNFTQNLFFIYEWNSEGSPPVSVFLLLSLSLMAKHPNGDIYSNKNLKA